MLYFRYKPSRSAIFALLMVCSVLALLLPPRFTRGLKHVMQLLVPLQDLAYSTGQHTVNSIRQLEGKPISDPAATKAIELASQTALVQQLRQENEHLRNLRRDHVDAQTPLLPARVVAEDMAQFRDSLLIARGSSRNVSPKDWALSHALVDKGQINDLEADQGVLAQEGLVGRVEQVSPYMARVQLFSDKDSPRIEVRIAHFDGNKTEFVNYPCSIRGAGEGKMVIDGVSHNFVNTGAADTDAKGARITVGDLVFSAPGQLGIPRPIIIGKVIAIEENIRKRLVYNVSVEPIVKREDLHELYIVPLVPIENLTIPQ